MKNKRTFICIIMVICLMLLAACDDSTLVDIDSHIDKPSGKIYLYGEHHGIKKILEKQLKLWGEYYHKENMRHLFVELPYYNAEFLNIWMKSDNDDILNELYNDRKDTTGGRNINNRRRFYEKIKTNYPETIFHGTDIGHQYDTTGERFLDYLEENNLKDTDAYLLTQEAITQGKYYYKKLDDKYREDKMAENFIREFDKLDNEDIMGIYGSYHTYFNTVNYTADDPVPSMANQLKKRYGDAVYSEDLSWLAKETKPLRVDTIKINGKSYEAFYYGKQDLTGTGDHSAYREIWHLKDAYKDFKDNEKTNNVLPYEDYPMLIEEEQVFVMDYTQENEFKGRVYYISNGYTWNELPSTQEFKIK